MDIGDRLYKPVKDTEYSAYASWCNKNGARLDDMGDFYEVVSLNIDKDRTVLEIEMIEKQTWLNQHDYIGTKIATGRATVEEYASEIQTMREYAQRIEEIREILGGNE